MNPRNDEALLWQQGESETYDYRQQLDDIERQQLEERERRKAWRKYWDAWAKRGVTETEKENVA